MPMRGDCGRKRFMNQSNSDTQSFLEKWWWAILFSLAILGIIVVTISISDTQDLPLTIIGAVLGVAMTIFATFFLFRGQSKQQASLAFQQSELQSLILRQQNEIERKREKETEIFKQKLNNYQAFLDALCKYVETKDEASKSSLKFRTAALAMHCDEKQITETNNAVGEIINMFKTQYSDDEKLLITLFGISDVFKGALYPDNITNHSEEYLKSIKTLTETFEQEDIESSDPEEEAKDTQEQEEKIDQESRIVEGWQDYVGSLVNQGWKVDIENDKINLTKTDAVASIRIRKPRKGTFYIIEVISNSNDSDFTKGLKVQFKGARSGGLWWRELTSLRSYGVTNGELTESLEDNIKARTLIIKWIDNLISNIK